MSDTSAALNRIAEILQASLEPSFLNTPWGQIFTLLFGIAFGAIATYSTSKRLERDLHLRERRIGEKKRKEDQILLSGLIGDEIALRWKGLIGKDLKKCLEEFKPENVETIYSTSFKSEDLFIFQKCSRDVFLANVFSDSTLVSDIVYVHTLTKDLIDGQNDLKKHYDKYKKKLNLKKAKSGEDDIQKLQESKEIAKKNYDDSWQWVKKVYEEIDSTMESIFARIEDDYSTYSKTTKIKKTSNGNIEERISEYSRQRLEARSIE